MGNTVQLLGPSPGFKHKACASKNRQNIIQLTKQVRVDPTNAIVERYVNLNTINGKLYNRNLGSNELSFLCSKEKQSLSKYFNTN